jgi:hypothetical protein
MKSRPHGWGRGAAQVGAAAASTAAFYTGTAVMTALLVRKGVLVPADLRSAPSAGEVRRMQRRAGAPTVAARASSSATCCRTAPGAWALSECTAIQLCHPAAQVGATLRPGVPYAFCIGSVVFSLLTATNLVTGV